MFELVSFVMTSGIVINVILLFLLSKQLLQNKGTVTQRILVTFFSLTLFVCIHFYAQNHEFVALYIISYIPADLIEWLLGPLLFLFVRSIFLNKQYFKANIKTHFIPSIIVLLGLTLPILISIINNDFIFSYLKRISEYSSIYVVIRNCYLMFYLVLSFRLLIRLEKYITSYYSFNRDKEIFWIKNLLIGTALVTMVDLFTELYEVFVQPLSWDSGYLSVVLMIFLIIYLGYYGLNQSRILLPDFLWVENSDEVNSKEKGRTKAKDQSKINSELRNLLEETMVSEKPYLNENLTLGELATLLNTTDKKLSVLLNSEMNIGFYDFINKYRIRHFVKLLKTDHLKVQTLFSLAQESGFKSKATFNRFFKKHYNVTPTAYLKDMGKLSQ